MRITGTHEIRTVATSIDNAPRNAYTLAVAATTKGALNIKTDAARRISGLAHAPAYPRSITFDVYPIWRGVVAEIGPDKDKRQGSLGNILEYGTVKNAPRPHLGPALEAEQPRFEAAIAALAVRALGLG